MGRQVGLHRLDEAAMLPQIDRGGLDFRPLGRDHQIEAVLGELPRQLEANPGRGAGHHCQRFCHCSHESEARPLAS